MSAAHGCFAMSFIRRSTACAQHFMPVNLTMGTGARGSSAFLHTRHPPSLHPCRGPCTA
ncbi:unnamed protein product [Ascophyllum nodosum]